jgi:hypothetical protein
MNNELLAMVEREVLWPLGRMRWASSWRILGANRTV